MGERRGFSPGPLPTKRYRRGGEQVEQTALEGIAADPSAPFRGTIAEEVAQFLVMAVVAVVVGAWFMAVAGQNRRVRRRWDRESRVGPVAQPGNGVPIVQAPGVRRRLEVGRPEVRVNDPVTTSVSRSPGACSKRGRCRVVAQQ